MNDVYRRERHVVSRGFGGHELKNAILYILIAVAVAAAYFALKDGLFEGEKDKKPKKPRSPRSTVRGIVREGRKVGRGAGRSFDSMDFGGRR